jgi:hypothetical protein
MSATITFDTDNFNRQMSDVARLVGRNGQSYVRTTARRLIKRFAYNAPKAPGSFAASGRLRAGFWPAAALLGISNIYTNQPNAGEGAGEDRTRDTEPSFTITNSVPYVGTLKDGLVWADEAVRGVDAQMARDLEKLAVESWERRDLIEDLQGE